MTAKEYLRRIRKLGERIDSLAAQRSWVTYKAEGVSGVCYDTIKVQASRNPHRQEDAVIRLVELEGSICDEVNKYLDMRAEADSYIALLQDQTEQNVLRNYYFTGMTWEQVAELMKYEVRQIFRIHGKALQHLQDKMSLNVSIE